MKRFRFGAKVLGFLTVTLVAKTIDENTFNQYVQWLATIGIYDGMNAGPAKVFVKWEKA